MPFWRLPGQAPAGPVEARTGGSEADRGAVLSVDVRAAEVRGYLTAADAVGQVRTLAMCATPRFPSPSDHPFVVLSLSLNAGLWGIARGKSMVQLLASGCE